MMSKYILCKSSEPVSFLNSSILVIVKISSRACFLACSMVLTLCPISNPKSHKRLINFSTFFCSPVGRFDLERSNKSMSEKGWSSPRPYPPTENIPKSLIEQRSLISNAFRINISIFSDL